MDPTISMLHGAFSFFLKKYIFVLIIAVGYSNFLRELPISPKRNIIPCGKSGLYCFLLLQGSVFVVLLKMFWDFCADGLWDDSRHLSSRNYVWEEIIVVLISLQKYILQELYNDWRLLRWGEGKKVSLTILKGKKAKKKRKKEKYNLKGQCKR